MGSGTSFTIGCSDCCSTRCGAPPAILGMGDDVCSPSRPGRNFADEAVPEWIMALAPSLAGEEAVHAAEAWAQCAEDLRERARLFAQRAVCGVSCRVVDQRSGHSTQAKYTLDGAATTLTVEALVASEGCRIVQECRLGKVQNIWVCADSALARRLHGSTRQGAAEADLACLLVIDVPDGMIAIVERGSEAREEFLDCMSVLIAAQRLRSMPELAMCLLPGGLPPPEARLRPLGRSLQSIHLSGPICVWLARVGGDALLATSPKGLGRGEVEAEYLHLPALDAEEGSDPPMLTPWWTSSAPVVPLMDSNSHGVCASPKCPSGQLLKHMSGPQSLGTVAAAAGGLGAEPHAPVLVCRGVGFIPSPPPLSPPPDNVSAQGKHFHTWL